jgi:hypothetical protein
MVPKTGGLRQVKHQIIRLIFRGGNFLQDYISLTLHFIFIKNGFREDVGENIECQLPVIFHDAGIICRGFHARRGVDFATDIFNFFGNALGGAALGAFEGHMFQKMRNAVFFRQFITRTRFHPNAYGRRFNVGHGVCDNG